MVNESQRLRGTFWGQLVGDALGSRYEFETSQTVIQRMAEDKTNIKSDILPMLGGGPFDLPPGHITDDSEMALSLLDSLITRRRFDLADIACSYVYWRQTAPPDIGTTTANALTIQQPNALQGGPGWRNRITPVEKQKILKHVQGNVIVENLNSVSNGQLMRQSPLAMAFRYHDETVLEAYIASDTKLTHYKDETILAAQAYGIALSKLIKGYKAEDIHAYILNHITHQPGIVRDWLLAAVTHPVPVLLLNGETTLGDVRSIGFTGVAFQGAFYEMLHAHSFVEGIERTIARGGDTDTNACIAGSLLGAKFGVNAIPPIWRETVASCKGRQANLPFLQMISKSERTLTRMDEIFSSSHAGDI